MRRFAGDDVRGRPARARGKHGRTAEAAGQRGAAARRQTAQPSAIIAFGWDETSTTNVYPTSLGEPAAVGESPPAGPI